MRRENTTFIASRMMSSFKLLMHYKKAQLSQRWLRDVPYIWVPWKFSRVPGYAHSYEILNGLLFRSIWMYICYS